MKSRGLSLLALCVLSVVWGYTWVLTKYGLIYCGPFSFAAGRTLIAAVCLLFVLRITGRSLIPRRVPELFCLGIVQTTGFVGLMMWALVDGTVGRTAFLVFTMPFWTLLLAWPLLGERVRGLQWAAVALAAGGLGAIFQPWRMSGAIASNMMAVGAGAAWAMSSIMVKRMQLRGPMDLVSMSGWQMVFGGVPLLIIAWLAGEPPIVWSRTFIVILLVTALISTALCWWLWMYVLKHVSAGMASMSTLAIPLVAIATSSIQLGERPGLLDLIGMGFIAIALIIVSYTALRRHRVNGPPGVR